MEVPFASVAKGDDTGSEVDEELGGGVTVLVKELGGLEWLLVALWQLLVQGNHVGHLESVWVGANVGGRRDLWWDQGGQRSSSDERHDWGIRGQGWMGRLRAWLSFKPTQHARAVRNPRRENPGGGRHGG